MNDAQTPGPVAIPDPREHSIERLLSVLELAEKGTTDLDKLVNHVATATPLENCGAGSRYSSSFDGARKLIPEGWVLELSERDPNQHHKRPQRWTVSLLNFSAASGADDVHVRHDDLALALCIAALKARSAK